ncbi:MAG TPA: hypothetical protein PK413_17460, partial [Thermoanaerobaculia bacterium]|nr:hypothetical protein [Thermoanaerobaculia bacterium]
IREAPESPAEPIDFSAPDVEGEPLEPPPIPADEPEPGPALERSPSPPAPLLEGEPMEAAPADEGEDRTLEPSSARELGRGHRRGEATPGIGEPTRESTRSIGPPPQPPLLPPRQGEAPEPPRTAYPRLDAPEQVTVGEEFEVVVGLAKKQQPGVAGPAMKLPPLPSLDLEVQVVAPGFRLRAGESWKQILRVTEQRPFPFTRLHLTAEAASEPTAEIQVFYAVAGQTRGLARRYLLVQQPEAPALRLAKPSLATGIDLAAPDAQDPVDLEVRISLDSTETRLSWTFASRHPLQSLSPSPDEKAIGPQARDFARLMIERIEQDDQSQDLGPRLRGVGMELGNRVPHRFWQLLAEARERAGKAPRVLLMTQEPYIPWELALVPPKFVEPKVPSFLGAQVEIGRWVFGDEWVPPRPPTRLEVGDLAVVTTKYTDDVAANLPHALEEGDELEKR